MKILILFLFCFTLNPVCHAQTSIKIKNYVFDNVALLTTTQVDSLNAEITELEKTIGSQLVIIIIDSLRGETIESFSLNLANKWGIGRKNFNDGVLITIAFFDKQIRIEVGSGLERIITDEIAKKMIRETIGPKFRDNNYFSGVYHTVIEIKSLIKINQKLIGRTR
jgi:uncharacterized membrane protein YgcG